MVHIGAIKKKLRGCKLDEGKIVEGEKSCYSNRDLSSLSSMPLSLPPRKFIEEKALIIGILNFKS